MDRRSLHPEDDFARALLRSAEADEPSSAAYGKVAAALGVGTAIGIGASLPAPAALASGVSAASSLARWSAALGAKLVLLGVSGVLLVGAATAFVHHRVGGQPALARAVAARESRAARAAQAELTSLAPAGAALAAEASIANVAPRVLAPAPIQPSFASAPLHAKADRFPAHGGVRPAPRSASLRSSGSSGSSGSSLLEQVQSLDRARVALNSGDAGAALLEIAYYRKTWPEGVFLTEASVLEIEALAKRGERSLAAARARAFVSAHPDSPQAERLRALIPADQP